MKYRYTTGKEEIKPGVTKGHDSLVVKGGKVIARFGIIHKGYKEKSAEGTNIDAKYSKRALSAR